MCLIDNIHIIRSRALKRPIAGAHLCEQPPLLADAWSALIIVKINKGFINCPAQQKAEAFQYSFGIILGLQNMIFDRGIIDKTIMGEAVNHLGIKSAIWVKYRPPLFIIITVPNMTQH